MRVYKLAITHAATGKRVYDHNEFDAEDLGMIAQALRQARESAEPWQLPTIDRALDCISGALNVRTT